MKTLPETSCRPALMDCRTVFILFKINFLPLATPSVSRSFANRLLQTPTFVVCMCFFFCGGQFNRASLEYHWTIPITVLITLVPGFFTTLKTFSRDLLFFKTQLIIFLRYKSCVFNVYRITWKGLNDNEIVRNMLVSRYAKITAENLTVLMWYFTKWS